MSVSMLTMLGALGAELLLVVLVLLTVSWLRNRAARHRDLQAMQKLVGRVKARTPEREKAISDFLQQRAGLSGESLSETQTALLSAELGLLHRFASIYSSRDAAAATRFDDDMVAALQPYNDLAISAEPDGAEAMDEAGLELADSVESELEVLRTENQRLSEQLQASMETMSRMVNEYSAMFDAVEQDADQPAGVAPAGAPVDAETAKETAEEAAPVVEDATAADAAPQSEIDDALSNSAADTGSSAGDSDSIPPTEPEPEHPAADATADVDPPTPIEPPADAPIAALSEEDSVDSVSNDPMPSAEAATADEVADAAPESNTEQSGNDQDETEVRSGTPDGAGISEPTADEAADGQAEPEQGDDAEIIVEETDLDVADSDSALPKAQTGS